MCLFLAEAIETQPKKRDILEIYSQNSNQIGLETQTKIEIETYNGKGLPWNRRRRR